MPTFFFQSGRVVNCYLMIHSSVVNRHHNKLQLNENFQLLKGHEITVSTESCFFCHNPKQVSRVNSTVLKTVQQLNTFPTPSPAMPLTNCTLSTRLRKCLEFWPNIAILKLWFAIDPHVPGLGQMLLRNFQIKIIKRLPH